MASYIYETLMAALYVAVAYGFYSKFYGSAVEAVKSKEEPEFSAMMHVPKYRALALTVLLIAAAAWPATLVVMTVLFLTKKSGG